MRPSFLAVLSPGLLSPGLLSPGLLSLALLSPVSAWAHAHLRTATPAPDATVTVAPATVAIDFTQGVEPAFSTIEVQDAAGHRVDTGRAATAPADIKRLVVPVGTLPPGTYQVIWHVTAVDTHRSEGSFRFTVAP